MAIMNQEAHQHVNCQISACRLALPSSLALTSHIKFNKCFFLQEYHNSQFTSASWIYDNFGKKNSWKLELVLPGFYLVLPGLPLIAKLVPVLDSAASSPSGETAVEKVCCFEKLPYPSWWKDGFEPTQKIRTHRPTETNFQ